MEANEAAGEANWCSRTVERGHVMSTSPHGLVSSYLKHSSCVPLCRICLPC